MVGRKIFFEVNVFSLFFDFMMVEPRPVGRLIGFSTGIPRVGISRTAPVPAGTAPLTVTGRYRPVKPVRFTVYRFKYGILTVSNDFLISMFILY